jgi:hypothetical protein
MAADPRELSGEVPVASMPGDRIGVPAAATMTPMTICRIEPYLARTC